MNKLLEGGNWDRGVRADFFRSDCSFWQVMGREITLYHIEVDREGLPDRWVKILKGEAGGIPKLVSDPDDPEWFIDDLPIKISDGEKKRIVEWYKRHKKEFG